MPTRHWELDNGPTGLNKGFTVVKSEFEWRSMWPTTDADKIPILPQDVDFSLEMLLVVVPPEKDALAAEVKEVVEGPNGNLHVYVSEQVPGLDCPAGERDVDAKEYDLARIRRVDGKEVTFHIDAEPRPPCGDPPKAIIHCRVNGTTTPFEEKLVVSPSTPVACVAEDTKSVRPVFDLTWGFQSLPSATFAKMAVAQGGKGASFVTDVFGTYKVSLEVTDDLQRKGTATADIEVAPPVDSLMLQFVWTKFDPSDDPSTFPRIELHVLGESPPEPPKKGLPKPPPPIKWGTVPDCTLDADKPPPAWCTVKAVGPTTLMTLDPASAKQYALALHYTDERFPGQPVACIRSYRNGIMQAELCDPQPRKEGWWEAGTIDTVSGKTPEGLLQEKAAAAAAAAAAVAKAAAVVAAAKAAEQLDAGREGGSSEAGTVGEAGPASTLSGSGASPREAGVSSTGAPGAASADTKADASAKVDASAKPGASTKP